MVSSFFSGVGGQGDRWGFQSVGLMVTWAGKRIDTGQQAGQRGMLPVM